MRLEDFTPEERRRWRSILRKQILIDTAIYIPIITCAVSVIIYFNYLVDDTSIMENLGLLNIAFIITLVIAARIYTGEFLEYLKEMRSPVKKVVDTRVVKRDGKVITIGNQQFEKEEILLDSTGFDTLQAGDHVRVEHSAKSHALFTIKRI